MDYIYLIKPGDRVICKYNKPKTLDTVIKVDNKLVTVQKDNGETYVVSHRALDLVVIS